ncbi:hypothetical protein CFN78_19225 [Amycolatopsis antarctica]|uniref:Uncharacterized protein n=1 Tax=Amycolatopsis antarctica TaxID=1854586 RepID=A0A263CZQ5_9PSEU|nr:hypothetical protein [Amycolatopsis antarctica]OZM71652.1 hypothetical protein CFN78_19225 [Amycolatopsis antarctica]
MDFDSAADEIYAVDRSEFVTARDEAVRRARDEGDRELAERLRALRKPTVAAWLVNRLAREHPEDVAELRRLGDRLRAAQAELAGDRLRTLARERGALLRELGGRVRELAGTGVGEAAAREAHDTLDAAVTDAGVADQVRAGRLSTGLTADLSAMWLSADPGTTAPFGASSPPPAARAPKPAGGEESPSARARAEKERAAERRREAEHRKAVERSRSALDSAEIERAEADELLAEAHRRREDAAEALTQARLRVEEAERAATDAGRGVTEARRRADRAELAEDVARRKLDGLG